MSSTLQDEISFLAASVNELSIGEALSFLAHHFPEQVTFSTSFSYEDQVIAHLIGNTPISIFTLDTGRLFGQTYTTWSSTVASLGVKIKAYYPAPASLEPFIEANGPDSFYQSPGHRKECCSIRKVEPLKRALKGNAIWVTGLRAAHSPDRENLTTLEWDESNGLIKYHPLLHWTTEEVQQYVHQHKLPFNALHEQGFVSIGCAPCTRAIRPGEDFRAGRWWWEDSSKKECGLHVHAEPAKA